MKGSNPDYQSVSKEYLQTLPTGTEMGETQSIPTEIMAPHSHPNLAAMWAVRLRFSWAMFRSPTTCRTPDQTAIWSGGFLDVDQTQHKRGRGEKGYPTPRGKLIEALSLWRWGHDGNIDYPDEDLLPRGPLP